LQVADPFLQRVYGIIKLIDKAIVINVKIHKNERKRLYLRVKENYLVETKLSWQISKFLLTKFQVKIKSQI
jgi:hypothetical protein